MYSAARLKSIFCRSVVAEIFEVSRVCVNGGGDV